MRWASEACQGGDMTDAVTLRPMTQSEYDDYRRTLPEEYAASHVEAGTWLPHEALAKAEAQVVEILGPSPDDQPDNLLLTAELDDSTPVGLTWLALARPGGVPDTAWIFDIRLYPEHRGKGLGRRLLAAIEQEAARHGSRQIELNVFGFNQAARHLYESTGYSVVAQQMRKPLS